MAVFSATQIFAFVAAIIASTAFYGTASAQAPAPGPSAEPGTDCFTTLLNMSDCLTYVSKGSTEKVPDKPCCPELAGLVESSPSCLCQLLSNPKQVGLNVDVDRAMKLPSACNVTTPPVGLCSVLGFPVGAGAGPAPSVLPPGVQPPDAGGSSAAIPGNNGNGASRIECFHLGSPLGLVFAFLPILL